MAQRKTVPVDQLRNNIWLAWSLALALIIIGVWITYGYLIIVHMTFRTQQKKQKELEKIQKEIEVDRELAKIGEVLGMTSHA